MTLSELTTAELTKLITLLSEEIAVLTIMIRAYPEREEEYKKMILSSEKIIEKLEQML